VGWTWAGGWKGHKACFMRSEKWREDGVRLIELIPL
jgi:hypothetical protein